MFTVSTTPTNLLNLSTQLQSRCCYNTAHNSQLTRRHITWLKQLSPQHQTRPFTTNICQYITHLPTHRLTPTTHDPSLRTWPISQHMTHLSAHRPTPTTHDPSPSTSPNSLEMTSLPAVALSFVSPVRRCWVRQRKLLLPSSTDTLEMCSSPEGSTRYLLEGSVRVVGLLYVCCRCVVGVL